MSTKTTVKFDSSMTLQFHQTIALGPLKLPEGACSGGGDLICFGEDETYVHCVFSHTGDYYGVFKKWPDQKHFYHLLRELNPYVEPRCETPRRRAK